MSHVPASGSDLKKSADIKQYRSEHLFDLSVEARWSAESSARAAHRLSVLGEMTGSIIHDFKNILAVIDSGLRLVASSANDPDRFHALIAGTREGLDRGLRLAS